MHTDAVEIKREFGTLFRTFRSGQQAFTTVTGTESLEADRKLASDAAAYTVPKLVKTNADIQLSFGTATGELASSLRKEVDKIDAIETAIEVESADLQLLNNILLAAEAIAVQKQEQEIARASAEENKLNLISEFETRQTNAQAYRISEEARYVTEGENFRDNLESTRARQKADRAYSVSSRKTSVDSAFAYEKETAQDDIGKQTGKYKKDWDTRTAVLDSVEEEIVNLRTQVSEFPAVETKTADDAQKAAISIANNTHKFEMGLSEKAAETQKTIDEDTTADLNTEIEELNTKVSTLNDATKGIEDQIVKLTTISPTSSASV